MFKMNICQLNLIVCLAYLVLLVGCKPDITISSANKPKTNAEALTLVGITMTPSPSVEYMDFQAGMDAHMDLVIRFPKNRLEEFWEETIWIKKDSKSLAEMSTTMREIYERKIQQIVPGQNKPVLELIRKSTKGIWCDAPADSKVALNVFLCLDQDPDDALVYINWFQF